MIRCRTCTKAMTTEELTVHWCPTDRELAMSDAARDALHDDRPRITEVGSITDHGVRIRRNTH